MGLLSVFFQINAPSSAGVSARKPSFLRTKLPFLFVGLGLGLSIIGVAIFPEFSPVAVPTFASIPVCASGLLLLLIGMILIMLFYFRRKNR